MGEKSMKDGDFTRAGILGVKYVRHNPRQIAATGNFGY
jgi:hypothetical protein